MKFARYIAVQILAYGLDMGAFLFLFKLFGFNALVANASGKVLAGIFAFIAHRVFTFSVQRDDNATFRRASMYFVLLAVNVPISSGGLALILLLDPNPAVAKFLADIICVFLSYWLSKTFVFAEGTKRKSRKTVKAT